MQRSTRYLAVLMDTLFSSTFFKGEERMAALGWSWCSSPSSNQTGSEQWEKMEVGEWVVMPPQVLPLLCPPQNDR